MGISFPYILANDTTADADEVMANFNEIKNNFDTDTIDDASANNTEMQAATDPYPSAAESLATDLRGELKRLRYLIKQITGKSQWYIDAAAIGSKGADVASASALPVLTDGNYFEVTGDATIDTINTLGVGSIIRLYFTGALTLTNSANLEMPGGIDHTTISGDELEFVENTTGKWRCTKIFPDQRVVRTRIRDIGDWDMDNSPVVTVNHGLTSTNIRSVDAMIRDDSGIWKPLTTGSPTNGSIGANGTTQVALSRTAGGIFDNTSYDSTSYNRGWITITYIA